MILAVIVFLFIIEFIFVYNLLRLQINQRVTNVDLIEKTIKQRKKKHKLRLATL